MRNPALTGEPRIPVLRPRLATAREMLPYLERIDATRTYSNFGPLVADLEDRITTVLGGGAVRAAAAGSGYLALVAAILESAGPARYPGTLAAMPSFTFVATALAAEACGYEPLILDVRPHDWQLDPGAVEAHPRRDRIGVVVPVAALGRPVLEVEWRAFQDRTGIPVVIDGGASLDRVAADPASHVGDVPVAFSLHATKSSGIGEGGTVVTTSAETRERVAAILNFGFSGSRETAMRAINGKLSEYAAAAGLAAFDRWEATQSEFEAVAAAYAEAFAARSFPLPTWTTPNVSSSYVVVACLSGGQADAVRSALDRERIGHRSWYGLGLHRQPLYRRSVGAILPVTDQLAPRLIGLPNAPDLDRADIETVVEVVVTAARDSSPAMTSAAPQAEVLDGSR